MRDHLRVCGADARASSSVLSISGSSPRVRSRQLVDFTVVFCHGIISACAEQTKSFPKANVILWDHLRVCGADHPTVHHGYRGVGSSPRVRSRQCCVRHHTSFLRIISACAEQTSSCASRTIACGDHLRVCGADSSTTYPTTWDEGSSPRVRSRLRGGPGDGDVVGIISACAEQTLNIEIIR